MIVFFLFQRIYTEWDKLLDAFSVYVQQPLVILLVIILMPINWMIEALKWKISIGSFIYISFGQAIIGVLTGISLGFVTPHAVGDYFARIWTISHQDRKKTIGPVMVNRLAQLIPTAVFGIFALSLVSSHIKFSKVLIFDSYPLYVILISCSFLFFLLIVFNKYGKHLKRISAYFSVLKQVSISTYIKLVLLSFIRYGVFSLQFIILLSLFELEISLSDQFLGVAFIFLSKSVLPTFNFFNDLGIREFSAVLFFDLYTIDTSPIILASLILWFINIAIPAIIGVFFIRRFKIDLV